MELPLQRQMPYVQFRDRAALFSQTHGRGLMCVRECLFQMKAWGFEYKSNIVWHKVRKDRGPDGRGVGFYFRNTTELILFGIRGKNNRTLAPGRSQVNILRTQKAEHSRKPFEAYELIERCSPGPHLELFSHEVRAKAGAHGAISQSRMNLTGPQLPDACRVKRLRRCRRLRCYEGSEITPFLNLNAINGVKRVGSEGVRFVLDAPSLCSIVRKVPVVDCASRITGGVV